MTGHSLHLDNIFVICKQESCLPQQIRDPFRNYILMFVKNFWNRCFDAAEQNGH
jgi:hypothetical protein